MLITKTPPATIPTAPVASEAPASIGTPTIKVSPDSLFLTPPATPQAPAKEPMNRYEAAVKKAAVVGTIVGGIAITSAVCIALASSMGSVGIAVLGVGLAADALMGLLAWHLVKTPLTR